MQQLRMMANRLCEIRCSEDFVHLGVSTEILRFFLGNEWTNENVFKQHPTVSKKHRSGRQYLLTEGTELMDQFRHQQRTARFAELLFHLQDAKGVEKKLQRILEGGLEATIAELEFAYQLQRAKIPYEFIRSHGKKGEDYDIGIAIDEFVTASAEVKSKSENILLSEKSIYNSLESARKQLPEDRPGLIAIKVPEIWVRTDGFLSVFQRALEKFFPKTQRVNAVVLRWEESKLTDELFFTFYRFEMFFNKNARNVAGDLAQRLRALNTQTAKSLFREIAQNSVRDHSHT